MFLAVLFVVFFLLACFGPYAPAPYARYGSVPALVCLAILGYVAFHAYLHA